MPLTSPFWDTDFEPTADSMKTWADNFYEKYEPLEQARWNQGNINTLFYAGEQRFINSYFNFYPTYNAQSFAFNFVQQPVNMVTGYQRQHRKSINYTPIEGSKQEFADDLTKVITYANNYRGILEKFSMGCEQSAISGMVLAQPYLDYTDDPINGTLDLKIWSYNSFFTDVYWREADMSDANVVWTQQYVSKQKAKDYFPGREDQIDGMSGFGNRYGKFYFLPENYNLARNDLLILSNVWFRSKRKKKMLYNRNDGIAYEYGDNEKYLEELIKQTGFFEIITVEVPTWKQAIMLNEQIMTIGANPLGFDECPFVPIFWNYDPHIAQYDLRVRSLVTSMRDAQFLLNRRVILNHDISESSINSGYYRRENAIANEEDLRYAGQGKDIIVKENGQPLEWSIQKIIPNAVPPSDMELANQLTDFIFRISGVNQELLGMADDSKTGIEVMLKQGAGLVTLQKYFDQWDVALKLIGRIEQKIIQNKWSPAKIARILGKEPNAEFLNKTFSKYDVLISEGLNTTIQQQQQYMQLRELNAELGGIIPPRFLLEHATIQGKNEIIEMLEQQQREAAEAQKQQMLLEHTKLEAELQEIHSRAAGNIAMARERQGRAESNIGLFEERLSEITQNRSASLKNKVEALEKLLQIFQQHDEREIRLKETELNSIGVDQELSEDREKIDAKVTSASNNVSTNMLQNNSSGNMMRNTQTRSALL
jgi:hypothetical protein